MLIPALPVLGRLLPETDKDVLRRRAFVVRPLELRVDDRLYLPAPPPAPLRKHVAEAAAKTPKLVPPAPRRQAPKPAAERTPPRRFELPKLARRVNSDQTILQPQFPPDLPIQQQARLPNVIFWSTQPNLPRYPPKRFIEPGHPAPVPPKVTALTAPPKLELPNREVMVSDLKIASGVFNSQPALPMPPATTMPIRTFVAPAPADGPPAETQAISIDAVPGDPANLLAISLNPAPPAKALLVPAGNQLGILPGPPPDEGVGGLSEEGGAGEGKGRGQPAVAGGSAAAGAKAGSGAARASGGSSAAGSSTADVLGGSAAGGSGTGDAQMLAMTRSSSSLASGTAVPARVMHPVNAVFDIVVQSSSSGIVPEAAGLLSNKPVYTVYIHIDQQRDWILQYCSPADVKQISRGGPNVVQLGNPAPVKAPFPLMTVTPPITSEPREEYLMVHGFLEATGRFKELKLVRESSPRFKDLILPFLEQWEFRPGTRDGVPVRLEILLVIPPNRA